jgi:hypothetical protein
MDMNDMIIGRIQNKDFVKLGEEIDNVLGKKIAERILVKKTQMLDKINGKINESEELDENYSLRLDYGQYMIVIKDKNYDENGKFQFVKDVNSKEEGLKEVKRLNEKLKRKNGKTEVK